MTCKHVSLRILLSHAPGKKRQDSSFSLTILSEGTAQRVTGIAFFACLRKNLLQLLGHLEG